MTLRRTLQLAALPILGGLLATSLVSARPTSNLGVDDPGGVGATISQAVSCDDLRSINFRVIDEAPTLIRSTSLVEATATTPEFCQVLGYVAPQVQFELRLPTETWNGRYMQTGGGGFAGSIPINSCADALSLNFAVAAQDMGHSITGEPLWGLDNEPLRVDFAHRSTHVVAVAAKAIISEFYDQEAAYSYFRGCSTGGREGLMEATRYPGDFDGILAGHPASPALQGAMANNWLAQVGSRPDPVGAGTNVILSAAKADLLHDAVMAECDDVDGLADGLIDDPRNCEFDPTELACERGSNGSDCLTRAELNVALKYYDGPRDSRGVRLYPGRVPHGSELGWPTEPPRSAGFANGQLKYLMYKDSPPLDWTFYDFDFDKDVSWGKLRYGFKLYDPFDPDLSKFRAQGGKLLLYHGLSDLSVSPEVSIDYYTEVAKRMGGHKRLRDWFRLFLVPGMFHCGGGVTPVRLDPSGPVPVGPDPLLKLVEWVESDTPPDSLVASYLDDGEVARTRPVFPYPQVARYAGEGSIDDAANFEATDPPVLHDGDISWIFERQLSRRR
jgi:Tannase and feruloyl esterase